MITACCFLLILLTLIAGIVFSRIRHIFSTGLGEPELLAYFTGCDDISTGSYAKKTYYQKAAHKSETFGQRITLKQYDVNGFKLKSFNTRSQRKSSYSARQQVNGNARAIRNREREQKIKEWMNMHCFPQSSASSACASHSPLVKNYYYPNIIFSPSVLPQRNSFSEEAKSSIIGINRLHSSTRPIKTSDGCSTAIKCDQTDRYIYLPEQTNQHEHVTVIHISDISANTRSCPVTPICFRPRSVSLNVPVWNEPLKAEPLNNSQVFYLEDSAAQEKRRRRELTNDHHVIGSAGSDASSIASEVVDSWETRTRF